MRLIVGNLIRLVLLATAFAATPAFGQEAKLQIGLLDHLAGKAATSMDVNLDEQLILLAGKFINPQRSKQEALAKELISGLKGVFVKRFEFDNEGEYTESDIEPLRAQLRAPGWMKIVNVRSRRKGNFDVLLMSEGNIIRGLAVVAAEPRALTIVNVVGPIDLEKLRQLEGNFGIPRFGLEQGDPADRTEPEEKRVNEKRVEEKPPAEAEPAAKPQYTVIQDKRVVKKPTTQGQAGKPPKE